MNISWFETGKILVFLPLTESLWILDAACEEMMMINDDDDDDCDDDDRWVDQSWFFDW